MMGVFFPLVFLYTLHNLLRSSFCPVLCFLSFEVLVTFTLVSWSSSRSTSHLGVFGISFTSGCGFLLVFFPTLFIPEPCCCISLIPETVFSLTAGFSVSRHYITSVAYLLGFVSNSLQQPDPHHHCNVSM